MNITVRYIVSLILIAIPIFMSGQNDISLNGQWQFWIPETESSASLPSVAKAKQTVTVPHTYNIMEGLEDYAGIACYSRELPVTPEMKGKNVRICFNGVYHDAIVSVNGHNIGEHLNAGYTPFSFDITDAIDFTTGAKNTVEVVCDNSFSDANLPWKRKFDWSNDGGIYRDVCLHTSGPMTLRYVHVTPQICLDDSTAVAHFDIRLWQPDVKAANIVLSVYDNSTGQNIYSGQHKLKLQEDSTFKVDIDCGKIKLWHFDNPNLYTFKVDIYDDKTLSDSKSERFGFRTFTVEGASLMLNGEPVRLPGIEEMSGSNPEYGMAETKEYMERSVAALKDLNCTLTRYHWAQDDYRLQLLDSLGILAQEEISWWQGPSRLNDKQMEVAKRQLSELIEAHYNHPCIWGWGMSNEVKDNRADIKVMADYARSLDNTRIIDAVCNHLWRERENDPSLTLDLPTWNEYIGTWHAKHRGQLPGYLDEVEQVLDGRPVLISEHGLCEPAFTGGDARRASEMFYHIDEWKRHPFVCGYIYFCVQDYRTQMGEEGYGKDRIRRHGVMTKDLQPKPSYYILRQLMNPIDITSVKPSGAKKNEGTLANLYDIDAANHSAEVTLRVKDDIPSYILRGYRLEYISQDDAMQVLPLSDMYPGESYTLQLPGINKSYSFSVKRADSSVVIEY